MTDGSLAGPADTEIGQHSLPDDLPDRPDLDTVGNFEGDLSGIRPTEDSSPSGAGGGSAPSGSGTDTLREVRIGTGVRRDADGGIVGRTEVFFSGLTPTGMELRSEDTDGDTAPQADSGGRPHIVYVAWPRPSTET